MENIKAALDFAALGGQALHIFYTYARFDSGYRKVKSGHLFDNNVGRVKHDARRKFGLKKNVKYHKGHVDLWNNGPLKKAIKECHRHETLYVKSDWYLKYEAYLISK